MILTHSDIPFLAQRFCSLLQTHTVFPGAISGSFCLSFLLNGVLFFGGTLVDGIKELKIFLNF